jgi:two-component system, NarL family, invasion response regulator UvrY
MATQSPAPDLEGRYRTTSPKMTRVLIIDDHPIVTQGCRQLLENARVTEIYEARDIADGYGQYRAHRPDVIILDLTIGKNELGGISFTQRLRRRDRQTPILVFTMHDDPLIVGRALTMGATGYVLKDGPLNELSRAFVEVCHGRTYVSPCLLPLASGDKRGAVNPLGRLNQRELETLMLLVEGKPYRAIAELMFVSCTTVATTSARVKAKLGVNTLPELMRAGLRYLPGVDWNGARTKWGREERWR